MASEQYSLRLILFLFYAERKHWRCGWKPTIGMAALWLIFLRSIHGFKRFIILGSCHIRSMSLQAGNRLGLAEWFLLKRAVLRTQKRFWRTSNFVLWVKVWAVSKH